VEGKQDVYGSRSLTNWEIDGRGVKIGGEGFVIIECRRWTKSKQKQANVAALATVFLVICHAADGSGGHRQDSTISRFADIRSTEPDEAVRIIYLAGSRLSESNR
jgi:hypothetical protein